MRILAILSLTILCFHTSVGQGLTDEMKDTEEKLYASTKQINQFLRRFNGEEDEEGNRYYSGDKKYRDDGLRKKYLPVLFDKETGYISETVAKDFIKEVTDKRNPEFLDLHDKEMFAEVSAIFTYKGKETSALLYMKMQQQGLGYEWVIDDVAFDPFKKLYKKDTSEAKRFMHPMSHELGFMTLRKALQNEKYPEQFTPREYQPDYLTLFLFELKAGNLKFKTVKNVKFHFFTIDNWYFELSNFNRPGYNTGWLISNLTKLEGNQKQMMKDYIYDKN
ncbi:hypothetical protein [Marinoscillum pacificum]|uniref:hypothetical protein n=1 Tax=Marinoscillum pacificum TaxID=392723 RepID=UPI0021579656|nr:hypothetical protein [Marinoscillum pacificum]